MSKKTSLSKVDAEDMVRIILTDAIEAEKASVKKTLERLPKAPSDKSELKKMIIGIAKPRGMGRIGYGCDIIISHPKDETQIEFNTNYGYTPHIEKRREYIDSDDIEFLVTERQWNDCVTLLNQYESRNEREKAINARLKELKSKLGDYKDLAARFRLGFAGDPTDLNSVNHKCKEYLLQKDK